MGLRSSFLLVGRTSRQASTGSQRLSEAANRFESDKFHLGVCQKIFGQALGRKHTPLKAQSFQFFESQFGARDGSYLAPQSDFAEGRHVMMDRFFLSA